MDDYFLKRTKQLAAGLMISGLLNVGLLLALFFVWYGAHTPLLSLDQIEAKVEDVGPNKAVVLEAMRQLPYEQLVLELRNSEQVEDGFSRRDLALGTLVSQHHFNLNKALAGAALQPRQFALGQTRLVLFPGLTEAQLTRVADYASTEQWPLTSEGLFLKLKEKKEPSLKAAFSMTSEYAAVETLVRACGLDSPKEQLIQMLAEGNWKELYAFALETGGELSNARLQKLLLTYVENCSPVAAEMLVHHYPEYALKRLDDQTVILLLRQLKSPSPAAEAYAKELLLSPRSRTVWQAAAIRLYQFHGEPAPKSFDYRATVKRFIAPAVLEKKFVKPKAAAVQKEPVAPKKAATTPPKKEDKKQFLHVVRQGESLWTIARQYHIDGEVLKKANSLKSNTIREGQVLIIP